MSAVKGASAQSQSGAQSPSEDDSHLGKEGFQQDEAPQKIKFNPIDPNQDARLSTDPRKTCQALAVKLERLQAYLHEESADLLEDLRAPLPEAKRKTGEYLHAATTIWSRVKGVLSKGQYLKLLEQAGDTYDLLEQVLERDFESLARSTANGKGGNNTTMLRATTLHVLNEFCNFLVQAECGQEVNLEFATKESIAGGIEELDSESFEIDEIEESAADLQVVSSMEDLLESDSLDAVNAGISDPTEEITGHIRNGKFFSIDKHLGADNARVPADSKGTMLSLDSLATVIESVSPKSTFRAEMRTKVSLGNGSPNEHLAIVETSVGAEGKFKVPQKHKPSDPEVYNGNRKLGGKVDAVRTIAGTYRLLPVDGVRPTSIRYQAIAEPDNEVPSVSEQVSSGLLTFKTNLRKSFSKQTRSLIQAALKIEDVDERAAFVVSRLKSLDWTYSKDPKLGKIYDQAGENKLALIDGMRIGNCDLLAYYVGSVLIAAEVPCTIPGGDLPKEHEKEMAYFKPGHVQVKVATDPPKIIDPTCWAKSKTFRYTEITEAQQQQIARLPELTFEEAFCLGSDLRSTCISSRPLGLDNDTLANASSPPEEDGHNFEEDTLSASSRSMSAYEQNALRAQLNRCLREYDETASAETFLSYFDNKERYEMLTELIAKPATSDSQSLIEEKRFLVDLLEVMLTDGDLNIEERLKLLRCVECCVSESSFSLQQDEVDCINRLLKLKYVARQELRPFSMQEEEVFTNGEVFGFSSTILMHAHSYSSFIHDLVWLRDRRCRDPQLLQLFSDAIVDEFVYLLAESANPKTKAHLEELHDVYYLLDRGVESSELDSIIATALQVKIIKLIEGHFEQNGLAPEGIFFQDGFLFPVGEKNFYDEGEALRRDLSRSSYFQEVLQPDGSPIVRPEFEGTIRAAIVRKATEFKPQEVAKEFASAVRLVPSFSLSAHRSDISKTMLFCLKAGKDQEEPALINLPKPDNPFSHFVFLEGAAPRKDSLHFAELYKTGGLDLEVLSEYWREVNGRTKLSERRMTKLCARKLSVKLEADIYNEEHYVIYSDWYKEHIDYEAQENAFQITLDNLPELVMHYFADEYEKSLDPPQKYALRAFKGLDYSAAARPSLDNWVSQSPGLLRTFGKGLVAAIGSNPELAEKVFQSVRELAEEKLKEVSLYYHDEIAHSQKALTVLHMKLGENKYRKTIESILRGGSSKLQRVIGQNLDSSLSRNLRLHQVQFCFAVAREYLGEELSFADDYTRKSYANLSLTERNRVESLSDEAKYWYCALQLEFGENPSGNLEMKAQEMNEHNTSRRRAQPEVHARQLMAALERETISPKKINPSASEFAELRDYRHGDNARQIYWPKSGIEIGEPVRVKDPGEGPSPHTQSSSCAICLDLEFLGNILTNDPPFSNLEALVLTRLISEVRSKQEVEFEVVCRGIRICSFSSKELRQYFLRSHEKDSYKRGVQEIRKYIRYGSVHFAQVTANEDGFIGRHESSNLSIDFQKRLEESAEDDLPQKIILFAAKQNLDLTRSEYQRISDRLGVSFEVLKN